jgi:hypothetical protein
MQDLNQGLAFLNWIINAEKDTGYDSKTIQFNSHKLLAIIPSMKQFQLLTYHFHIFIKLHYYNIYSR